MGGEINSRRFWSFTAIVLLWSLALVQAMAASGDLHEDLHDHGHHSDHECVVTLMIHGGYAIDLPDIVPVTVKSEPPDVAVPGPIEWGVVPGHLTDGVLANAPPRGP